MPNGYAVFTPPRRRQLVPSFRRHWKANITRDSRQRCPRRCCAYVSSFSLAKCAGLRVRDGAPELIEREAITFSNGVEGAVSRMRTRLHMMEVGLCYECVTRRSDAIR